MKADPTASAKATAVRRSFERRRKSGTRPTRVGRVLFVRPGDTLAYAIVGSVLSAGVLAMRFGREVWLGMLAPLVVMIITWVLTERVYKVNPARLTSVMIGAFAGKLVFFGAYVGLAIGVLGVQPVPFIVSFTGYFISLHLIEALWLKRLFVS